MTEILFLTHNRRAFTAETLEALLENTRAILIAKVWFFDDRSTDGTFELVEACAQDMRCPWEIVRGAWDSPVDAMADFFQRASAPLVAKIDSDTMLPPGWLDDCEELMAQYPDVDVLGIEARGASSDESAPSGVARRPDASVWVGGIVVCRREALIAAMARRPLYCHRNEGKYFGWQGFQEHTRLRTAWIVPSLQVFLLDRMPMEPWRSLSAEYERKGWQRPAPYRYGPEWAGLWGWAAE